MIDTTSEQLIPLADATRRIPPARSGKRSHFSTLLRWVTKGTAGPDGRTIHLEALRVGGRWMTSAEALQRFFVALTPRLEEEPPEPPAPPPTPTQRQRAHHAAEKRLQRIGL
jgi:hypothetical protein